MLTIKSMYSILRGDNYQVQGAVLVWGRGANYFWDIVPSNFMKDSAVSPIMINVAYFQEGVNKNTTLASNILCMLS